MRIISTILICIATFFTLGSIIPTESEYQIYDSCVRLHVIANSDGEKDQELKLKVRDELLNYISKYEVKTKEEALSMMKKERNSLEEVAKRVVNENGYDYDIKIEIGLENYPRREYEEFALPAGEYTSVRVIIGEGKGQNWWCVLYPPLCTGAALSYDKDACIEVGLTSSQYDLITGSKGKYKVKFKLVEMAAGIVGFDY
jgi:stage II sporulation protein R